MKRVKTMNLGKGGVNIAYAKVPARVAEFHKGNKNGKIHTEYEFKDTQLVFRATITPDVKNPERNFVGTSFGKIANDKALEKLETVAVGRALAFAGYLADGEIASAEEMEKYSDQVNNVGVSEISEEDLIAYTEKLESSIDEESLKKNWVSIPKEARDKLEGVKDDLKAKFQKDANN